MSSFFSIFSDDNSVRGILNHSSNGMEAKVVILVALAALFLTPG